MFALSKLDDTMMPYSEAVERFYQGYAFDENKRLTATTAKTVNLELLHKILLSSDEKLLEENAWMFDGSWRFLD